MPMGKYDIKADPRGLMYEAYRMDLRIEDARTIFFDWAIGLNDGADVQSIRELLDAYGPDHPNHPMTTVLREGLDTNSVKPTRRGGRGARQAGKDRS